MVEGNSDILNPNHTCRATNLENFTMFDLIAFSELDRTAASFTFTVRFIHHTTGREIQIISMDYHCRVVTITEPPLHCHCAANAPSLYRHRTITAPSLHHHGIPRAADAETKEELKVRKALLVRCVELCDMRDRCRGVHTIIERRLMGMHTMIERHLTIFNVN